MLNPRPLWAGVRRKNIVQQFYQQSTLRNKYIGEVPIYRGCLNCHMPFTHGVGHQEAGLPTKSKYPYCMKCLKKNAQDPGFVLWLRKIFGIKKQ